MKIGMAMNGTADMYFKQMDDDNNSLNNGDVDNKNNDDNTGDCSHDVSKPQNNKGVISF